MGLRIVTKSASGGSDQALTLEPRVISSLTVPWSVAAGGCGSVQWLGDGSSSSAPAAGSRSWTPRDRSRGRTRSPTTPVSKRRAGRGSSPGARAHVRAHRRRGCPAAIFAVDRTDPAKPLVWQYGVRGQRQRRRSAVRSGLRRVRAGQYRTGGQPTVLIADADATAPGCSRCAGPTTARALPTAASRRQRRLAVRRQRGTGDGQLVWPDRRRARERRLDLDRRRRSRPGHQGGIGATLLWQYGVSGSPRRRPATSTSPMGAGLEPNGDIDHRRHRQRPGDRGGVATTRRAGTTHGFTAGSIVWHWSAGAGGALGQPRLAERATGKRRPRRRGRHDHGALLVCDQSGQDTALVGNTGGGESSPRRST